MADIVIRPSMKFIKAGYVCALLVVCAAVFVHYKYLVDRYPEQPPYLPIASLLLLLWPIKRHLRRQTVKLTIAGDKLRYETGLTSKSMRIIQLPKVQDVRVIQSSGSGCSASEISRSKRRARIAVWWWRIWTLPRELAEQITDASAHPPSTGLH